MNVVSTQGALLVRRALRSQNGRVGIWADTATAIGTSLAERLRHWRGIRRTRKRLSELDDRMLADLGFHRDQIGLVARRGRLPEWDEM